MLGLTCVLNDLTTIKNKPTTHILLWIGDKTMKNNNVGMLFD